MSIKLTKDHEQALIDAIEDAEQSADNLVDELASPMLDQADRLAEVLAVVRSAQTNVVVVMTGEQAEILRGYLGEILDTYIDSNDLSAISAVQEQLNKENF